ncbi:MAG: SGNH/GDSL hydrolase family protein [Myxococcota bacterium]|nr:SGNH/GDSL hydrolase family protein [Myxococcota bacterium]
MRTFLVLGAAVLAVCVACGGNGDDGGDNEPTTTLAGDDDQPPVGDDDQPGDPAPTDQGPPPVLGPLVRICPMGDSITAGTGERASYRRPLWQSLLALGVNVDFVGSMDDNNTGPPPFADYDWDNEGHGGYRADELADRLPEWILEYDVPDIVLLHIGTNDLLQDDSTNGVLDDIDRLLGIIRGRNPNAIIILARIIGMTTQSFTDKASALNTAMPAFVTSRGTTASPIYLVDQMTGFTPATMTYDGTHPNELGERHMADVWLAALRPLLD